MKLLRIWRVTGVNRNSHERDDAIESMGIITTNDSIQEFDTIRQEAIEKFKEFLKTYKFDKLKLITEWVAYVERGPYIL